MKGYAWLVVLVAVLVLQQNVGARSLTKNKQLTALQRLLKVKELVRALETRDDDESSDSYSYESSVDDKSESSESSIDDKRTERDDDSSESSESSVDDKRTERDDDSSGSSASKEGDDKGWSNDVKAELLQEFYKMLKRM